MFFNFAFITLSLFCAFSQASVIQARELEQRDLVQDVVLVLELLHASSFCSSFAPQPTVVVTDTVVTSQTTTTSATSTAVTVASDTVSTTATVFVTETIIVDVTQMIEATETDILTATSTATIYSTVSTTSTITTGYIVNPPARRVKRDKPSALQQYADDIISSACHSYVQPPTTSTTLTQIDTFTDIASQTQTITSTITAATTTLTTTLSMSTTATSMATTTETVDISTTQSTLTSITSFTTIVVPTTTTYTYSIVTAGTGCGDIVYYNYLQNTVVTTQECLDYCSSMSECQSVMLQCSESEPCECTVNSGPYSAGDLQCALPTQYYGEFTFYNKLS